MSFVALYAENASILSTHVERRDAVRDSITIAMQRPDLSTDVGIAEISDETGLAVVPFMSASDLLAQDDPDAVATANAFNADDAASVHEVTHYITAGQAAAIWQLSRQSVSRRLAALERDLGPNALRELGVIRFGQQWRLRNDAVRDGTLAVAFQAHSVQAPTPRPQGEPHAAAAT